MDTTMESGLRRIVTRNLLRYAVGQAVTCPTCGDILDARRAVLITAPSGSAVRCARCWGRGPFQMDDGRWAVVDGRVLFARPSRRVRR